MSDKELFLAIFENWSNHSSQKQNKNKIKFLVEKTPQNEFYLSVIDKWFPDAKFIYVVRDPRDNYLSYKKKQPNLNLINYMYFWKESIRIAKGIDPNRMKIVKYEDLVVNTNNVMKDIAIFLDILHCKEMLTPSRNGKPWGGNSMFDSNDSNVHSAAVGRWKNKLEKSIIKKIESTLFDELNYLGYKTIYSCKKSSLLFFYSFQQRIVKYIKDLIKYHTRNEIE